MSYSKNQIDFTPKVLNLVDELATFFPPLKDFMSQPLEGLFSIGSRKGPIVKLSTSQAAPLPGTIAKTIESGKASTLTSKDETELLEELLKIRNAAIRGLINGASNVLAMLAVITVILTPVIEILKSSLASVSSQSSIITEHPEAIIGIAVLIAGMLLFNAIRTGFKYTQGQNEDQDAKWRDQRTALDGAVGNAALVYGIIYNVLKVIIPDPTSIIPSLVAGVLAMVAGLVLTVMNNRHREFFTAKPGTYTAKPGEEGYVSKEQRLASARMWGVINGLSFAGNITMMISLLVLTVKALAAVMMTTSIAATLPLSSAGLITALIVFTVITIACIVYNRRVYADIENKKINLEQAQENLTQCKPGTDEYKIAEAQVNTAKMQYDEAKNSAAKFRQHRLVFGTALVTFSIIFSIGLGLAALAAPIPPLSLFILGVTLFVATAATVYVVSKGVEAYKDPKELLEKKEEESSFVEGLQSVFFIPSEKSSPEAIPPTPFAAAVPQ